MTITGTLTAPLSTYNLNGIRFVDGVTYTTIQAAITAAGATGSVVIPPAYAGTDTYTNPSSIVIADFRTGKAFLGRMLVSYSSSTTAFGDSITVGSGATVPATGGYAALTSLAMGYALTNSAVSGTQIHDAGQADAIFAVTPSQTSRSFWLTGFNDMRFGGATAANLATYKGSLYGLASYLAIPSTASKLLGTSSSITYVGSWSVNSAYGNIPKYSQTNGNTATFSVRGTTIYICTIAGPAASTGAFSVAIDGGVATSYDIATLAPCVASNGGRTYAPYLIRIANQTEGKHSVVVTVTSATGAKAVNIVFVAGNAGARNYKGPHLFLGNCLRMNTTGYALSAPFNVGSDASVVSYNAAIKAVVRDLAQDGLGIVYVDAAGPYDPDTSDVNADNIHPSDTGHGKIAAVFESAMTTAIDPLDRQEAQLANGIIPNLRAQGLVRSDDGLPLSVSTFVGTADALTGTLSFNRNPADGTNVNSSIAGAVINMDSSGNIIFYSTSSGATGTATEIVRNSSTSHVVAPGANDAYRRTNITLANGANSDIALSGTSFAKIVGPTGVFSVSGFAGGNDGRVLRLYNSVAFAMTITNNATSSAANRILTLTGGDVVLRAGQSFANFIYDSAQSLWILTGTN